MEDVLDLYADAYSPEYPVVCFDEKRVLLLADKRPPVPVQPGQSRREDYEYARHGERNLFVLVEPKGGVRHVIITEQRCRQDYARALKWLVDEGYPQAQRIRVVQDNLNTHTPASLYATFAPQEARRILRKLEFHYTPKHGSWLNMAEIEIGVFERQCLRQRLGDEATLRRVVAAVEERRNREKAQIVWRFTTDSARTKLQRLYPTRV